MFHLDQRRNFHINFDPFKKLLCHVSRVVNLSVEIKDLNGDSIVRTSEKSGETACDKQRGEPHRCHAVSSSLFSRIEKSGKTEVQKCIADADVLGIPVRCNCNNDLPAMLFACSRTGTGTISNEIKEFLEELAKKISSDIQNQHEIYTFTHELSEKYEELNLIYDIGNKIGGISSTHKAITYIIEQAKETLYSNIILTSIPGYVTCEISNDNGHSLPKNICTDSLLKKIDEEIMKKLTSPEIPLEHIVLNNVRNDDHFAHLIDVPMGLLAVPVRLKGVVQGFLCIVNFDLNKSFKTGDVRMAASLAYEISLVLTNAQLYQDLKNFLTGAIRTLVYSIEAKDAYTKGHSERVNNLAMMMADYMDFSAEEKEMLNWVAILHDIGKLGVPEEILTKPGKLTSEEFMHIKEHPVKGYKILTPIDQLKDCLEGIHHHHERFDGTGYPSGLKGKEIPLYARIIAIADTYDAMTSTRSYREPMSHEHALAEIVKIRGTQLDPEIVDIFLKVIEVSLPTFT